MINIQPIEKQDLSNPGTLKVHSIFLTIQGEGIFSGRRAVFIRLAGCNLQCPSCDTDYTSKVEELSLFEIEKRIQHAWGSPESNSIEPLVVITGGEPFRQNLSGLIGVLQDQNFVVQIETNGTLFQDLWGTNQIDPDKLWVVCSPKTGKINKKLLPYIDAFKYVLRFSQMADDGLPLKALDHPASPILARPPKHSKFVFLQPEDSKDQLTNLLNQQAVVKSCLKFGYILCLQTHKIVNVD